jgi:hypothetical protein
MNDYPYCSALDADEGIQMLSNRERQLTPAQLVDLCAFVRDQGVRVAHLCQVLDCKNYQVSHWVRIGRRLHPEVKDLLHRGRISLGHCRVIANLPLVAQIEVARQAIVKKASVRDLEKQQSGTDTRLQAADIQYYARLSERMSEVIGHPIAIQPSADDKNSGVMSITYSDQDMFEAICDRLRINLQDIV